MDGLIIKKKWLGLILEGKKTWEIRSCNTRKRGLIALIESGSGEVKGTCCVDDSRVFNLDLCSHWTCHGLSRAGLRSLRYKTIYAWILRKPRRIKPVKYKHPRGAIVWVKNVLNNEDIEYI